MENRTIWPTLGELVAYVRDADPGADALELLESATAYAATLGQLGDAMVGSFVDGARAAGASWSQIGERLGVTRQGAQQRFVPREPVDLEALTPASLFSPMTARTRAALEAARDAARRRGHAYIGTEHVLLGAVSDERSFAAQALAALAVTPAMLEGSIDAMIEPGSQTAQQRIPFTPRARKALNLALGEALDLGHSYVGTEHVLLGLLSEGGGIAAQVLHQHGVTQERVREQIVALLADYRAARAAAAPKPDRSSTDPGN